ncbi:MAG: VTT domain-containing protein [Thermodesulfobacteriota bacterium]
MGRAERFSFLIDADVYFRSLISAIDQAKHTVYISGWDINSQVRLSRSENGPDPDITLGAYLYEKAGQTPGLEIYILCWDFSLIYTLEREFLPAWRLGSKTHERIHFHLDDDHPTGASHHQKFVVVDDALAFCGGLDLTKHRWDTPRHDPHDPRRRTPNGLPYPPFHDIQAVTDGDMAIALGDLFRLRWLWATEEKLSTVDGEDPLSWPREISPHVTAVRAGISRTLPAYKDRKAVQEVKALYLDMFAAARQYVYVENQYFTSPVIGEALITSLREKKGPGIVLVLPRNSSGLLEKSTMDALRARHLRRVLAEDHHNRLRVVYPTLGRDGDVFVHAKIMIVDDRLARVGSSNLTNRSMGLDTECDLTVEVSHESPAREGIIGFRNRLLSEHTGKSLEEVDEAFQVQASFLKAFDSLQDSERHLQKLNLQETLPIDGTKLLPDTSLLDPHGPVKLDEVVDQFVEEETPKSKKRAWLKTIIILTVLLGFAAAWRWTPLSQYINPQNLADLGHSLKAHALSPLGVMAAYVAAGLLMVPVTILVGVTAMVFPPWTAGLYALSGCILSAVVSYSIGAVMGTKTLNRLAGRRIIRLSKRLAKQGILTVAVVRNLPLAPFSVVNMVAGASHIKFWDYVVGTAIGMAPGVLAIILFADRLLETIRDPEWINILLTAGLAIAFFVGFWWVRRRLEKRR